MPKKGQSRDLPQDLRGVLADNLTELMERHQATNADIERSSGINHGTLSRIRAKKTAPTIDTVQAIAKVFEVEPWLLLMKGGVESMGKVFTTPVPDERLGNSWTRPDRRPLLQSSTAKSSTKQTKIKFR